MARFGDTPRFDGKSLCESCRCAQVTTGVKSKDAQVLCRMHGNTPVSMPQPVLTCSDYDDKRQPPLWEMDKIAWRLSVDIRKKTAGFVDPATWKQRVKDGLEVDD